GVFSIEILTHRLERSSRDALRAVAMQAAARIDSYLDQQRTLVRTIAAALAGTRDLDARLQAVPLDAPSISRIPVVAPGAVAESPAAVAAARNVDLAPVRYQGGAGEEVLAGWAFLADPGWTVVVEQPVREALRGARAAQLTLAAVAIAALLLSIGVGVVTS